MNKTDIFSKIANTTGLLSNYMDNNKALSMGRNEHDKDI